MQSGMPQLLNFSGILKCPENPEKCPENPEIAFFKDKKLQLFFSIYSHSFYVKLKNTAYIKIYFIINFVWKLYFFRFLAIYHINGLWNFSNKNLYFKKKIHILYICLYVKLKYTAYVKMYVIINFVWNFYFFRFLAIYHKNGLRNFSNKN